MSEQDAQVTPEIGPLGLEAFDSLRAEDEPWLPHCFIRPPEFDLITGPRSVVVFGAWGSGKTALFQALRRYLTPETGRPTRLSFEWFPQLDASFETEIARLLSAGAKALALFLAHWPRAWGDAPDYARTTLLWMMRRWLDDAFLPAADQWGDQVSKDGQTLLRDLASQPVHAPYLDKATPDQVISEVVKALAKTGLADVCVLIGPDNLNGPAAGDTLLQFMQKLELFQNHRLVYKLILPASLSASLSGTEAICRRRLKKYRLRWKNSHLTQLVALRFRLATGGKIERLDDLSQYEHKIAWLARSGGDFPRGWLDQARPLAKHYLSLNRALSKAEWQEVYRQYPPDLWLDEEKRQVTVGHHRIDDIPAVEWAVLRYLYQHRDRICTRDELYHNAHMPASSGAQTKERFFPKEYEGALNNVLSRLRQAIEPDPKHPLFITTYRGRGVRLEHAW